jgi:hypothetical protein
MKAYIKGLRILTYIIIVMQTVYCYNQSIDFDGMLAGWGTASYSEKLNGMLGIRYVPALKMKYPVREKFSLDSEISLNAWANSTFWSDDSIVLDEKIKPYRLWLKFSGDRFEIRAGLQKINFGSAVMLRPLMWFDRIDPRDPLQITDGVYGLLGRYYFLNNTNIWMWMLYGNDDPKGWEFGGTWRKWPELGGRIQIPVFTGEIAGTYHFRQADFRESGIYDTITYQDPVNENRIGMDGKFDLLVGLWFEGAMIRQDLVKHGFQRYLNLGADYTFNLGNGLNLMTEFFNFSIADKAFIRGDGTSFTAVSLTYPFSIINNLNFIIFYDWGNSDLYNFINWSWQFDKWSFYLMGFWNPDRFQVYPGLKEVNLFAGKGLQIMAVFNH